VPNLRIIGLPCFPYSYQLALGLCGGFFNEGYPLPQLLKQYIKKLSKKQTECLVRFQHSPHTPPVE